MSDQLTSVKVSQRTARWLTRLKARVELFTGARSTNSETIEFALVLADYLWERKFRMPMFWQNDLKKHIDKWNKKFGETNAVTRFSFLEDVEMLDEKAGK